jgi:hypothetical protein
MVVFDRLLKQRSRMVETTTTPWRRRLQLLFVGIIIPMAVLGLLVLIAVSPLPMRGAEMFGMIANKIKGHPGATAYWTIFALSILWVVIGLIAAIQEWRVDRRNALGQRQTEGGLDGREQG